MKVRTIFTERDMEIVNLATSVAAGCQPCMKYHFRKCNDAGIFEKEIHDILQLAEEIYIRAIKIMKLRAPALGNTNSLEETLSKIECKNRMELLVGLAVSFTVNNKDICERYLHYARQSGMSDSEISRIRGISEFILSKARTHVELLMEDTGVEKQDHDEDESNCGCGC
jgi:AhpD family alkylhydroperoxidase